MAKYAPEGIPTAQAAEKAGPTEKKTTEEQARRLKQNQKIKKFQRRTPENIEEYLEAANKLPYHLCKTLLYTDRPRPTKNSQKVYKADNHTLRVAYKDHSCEQCRQSLRELIKARTIPDTSYRRIARTQYPIDQVANTIISDNTPIENLCCIASFSVLGDYFSQATYKSPASLIPPNKNARPNAER